MLDAAMELRCGCGGYFEERVRHLTMVYWRRHGGHEIRMGTSGPQRGRANPAGRMTEAKVVDTGM